MKKLKVLLVDDNVAFRSAFKMLLESRYDSEIIGEASSAKELLELNLQLKADIIFMDIMMPEIDGIILTKELLWRNDGLLIVAVTMHYNTVYLKTLIEAGFVGCLFKNSLFEELPHALETIAQGKRYFPKDILLTKK